MSLPFVDLKAQYQSLKSEIDQAMAQVIENTSFIGGEQVRLFEEAFGSFIGAEHCISCANGTDAIEIALMALGIGPGDEVIVPANSWISTAEAVNSVGAEPIFLDVLEREYTMDPGLLEDVISDRTKAIIPVHLYGLPVHMPEIMSVAKKYDLKVIEDCAQAHGAQIDGQKVGTFGDIGTFSFYPGKNLGAYGDAGALVTNNEAYAEKCRRLTNHGQLKKHEHKILGRNSRLDTLQAAILSVKLPYLDQWNVQRKQVAEWYGRALPEEFVRPRVPEGFEHVFHLYVIQVSNRPLVERALADAGIGYAIHYPEPLPFVKAYLYQGKERDDFPVANKLSKKIISLPIYPELTEGQVTAVCRTLQQALD